MRRENERLINKTSRRGAQVGDKLRGKIEPRTRNTPKRRETKEKYGRKI
jgi:hypothetical protein